jgi:hypothetical protein
MDKHEQINMHALESIFSAVIIIVIGSLSFVFRLEVIIKERGFGYNKLNFFNLTKKESQQIMGDINDPAESDCTPSSLVITWRVNLVIQ